MCDHSNSSCDNNKYKKLYNKLITFGKLNWGPLKCEVDKITRQCQPIKKIIQENAPLLYKNFSGGKSMKGGRYIDHQNDDYYLNKLRYEINLIRYVEYIS
jgi:hypothetical protein